MISFLKHVSHSFSYLAELMPPRNSQSIQTDDCFTFARHGENILLTH
jgi:hypothetical protein